MSRRILSHFIPHGDHVLIGPLGKLGSALLWIHVLVSVIVARVVLRLLKSDAERVVKKAWEVVVPRSKLDTTFLRFGSMSITCPRFIYR